MSAILKFDFQELWQLHFPYNKLKQEQAVDPFHAR